MSTARMGTIIHIKRMPTKKPAMSTGHMATITAVRMAHARDDRSFHYRHSARAVGHQVVIYRAYGDHSVAVSSRLFFQQHRSAGRYDSQSRRRLHGHSVGDRFHPG